jgi:glycosyltransferase involved in cell wall biosynthesis
MADVPAVSVVIPLYNKGPYIARALNSVLAQTFQDFEVIVVDDGSTDDGAEVVRSFEDPRIRLIQQENRGVSAARNRGIEAARAELVAFLDADDEWLPKFLGTIIRLRKNYPEAGAYGTAYYTVMEDLTIRVGSLSDYIPSEPWEGLLPSYFKADALGAPPVSASTVAVPKCILIEMRGFATNVWYGEDTDLWGRIALKYPIAFSWDGRGIYHTEISNRTCKKIEPIREHIFVTSARDALQAGEVPPELIQDVQEYVASKQIQVACRNLAAGRPDLAKNNLKDCKTRYLRRSKYWTLFWSYIPPKVFIGLKHAKSKMMSLCSAAPRK